MHTQEHSLGDTNHHKPATLAALNALISDASIAKRDIDVTIVTGNYTPTLDDSAIIAKSDGGALTITLPDPAVCRGRIYYVKRSGSNKVTVSGQIDGGTNVNLSLDYKSVTVISDGTQWYKV